MLIDSFPDNVGNQQSVEKVGPPAVKGVRFCAGTPKSSVVLPELFADAASRDRDGVKKREPFERSRCFQADLQAAAGETESTAELPERDRIAEKLDGIGEAAVVGEGPDDNISRLKGNREMRRQIPDGFSRENSAGGQDAKSHQN